MAPPKLSHEDYTVAWICPLEVEQVAAVSMLDEEHQPLPQSTNDHNGYTLGSINGHNVVIAGLPTTGNCSAATVVAQMTNTFRQLRFGLLVGIGGGVPTKTEKGPVRLGHVVVSMPTGGNSGAVQYDHGKAEANGVFNRTGCLAPPPTVLLSAARLLEVARRRARKDPLMVNLGRIDTSVRGLREYKHPGLDEDILYEANYAHLNKNTSCKKCSCDPQKRVDRYAGESDDENEDGSGRDYIVVHRGTIASGGAVVKDGVLRDRLAAQTGNVLCFEMEAAGALNDFPCLVIRGISDYSDSHKNDKWHGFAAATAAAYARQLFFHMPLDQVASCNIAQREVKDLLEDVKIRSRNRHEKIIKAWLDPVDASNLYNMALERRHTGTGRWLLDSDKYRIWKTTSESALWLYGISGCGKTILSATVNEDLQKLKNGEVVLYFNFDFNDVRKQTFDDMIRSLTFQLYEQSELCRRHLQAVKYWMKPRFEDLVATLCGIIAESGRVSIVIDALDECTTRNSLMSWLLSPQAAQLHLFLTSREDADIESSLQDRLPVPASICVQRQPVNNDIRSFLRASLRHNRALARWQSKPDVLEEIESSLMQRADGMYVPHLIIRPRLVINAHGRFRWVACQLDALERCINVQQLRKALKSLPKTLDDTYARVLEGIPEVFKDETIRILQFLLFSDRPLQLDAAVDVAAVCLDEEPPFDSKNRMPYPKELVMLCSSLVTLRSRPGTMLDDPRRWDCRLLSELARLTGKEPDRPTVTELRLAHYSVKEFLTSNRLSLSWRPFFKEANARAAMVNVSLAYWRCIIKPSITSYNSSRRRHSYHGEILELNHVDARDLNGSFPFAIFSGQSWLKSAAIARAQNNDTRDAILKFLTCGEPYQIWFAMFSPDREAHVANWQKLSTPPIYLPASLGMSDLAAELLQHDIDVNAHGGRYGTALQAASSKGHADMVQLLIDHGADVEAECGEHGTALAAAIHNGHTKTTQLLLDRGANPAKHWRSQTPLQVASHVGHVEIAQLLLERGADVRAEGVRALVIASSSGHEQLVQLLLASGAKINGDDPIYGIAMHAAAKNGQFRVVQQLISHGADVGIIGPGGITGPGGYTPLHHASGCWNVQVVQLLLDNGADVHATSDDDDPPLIVASDNGTKETVQLLLDHGADVRVKTRKHRTALGAASYRGRYEIAATLLRHGADVESEHGDGITALYAATLDGDERVVQLLLNHGAKVEYENKGHRSALCAAAYRGNKEIVQLLLAYGANVRSEDVEYGTPLRAAATKNFDTVVQLLLNYGASIEEDEAAERELCSWPKTLAVKLSMPGGLSMAEWLLERAGERKVLIEETRIGKGEDKNTIKHVP